MGLNRFFFSFISILWTDYMWYLCISYAYVFGIVVYYIVNIVTVSLLSFTYLLLDFPVLFYIIYFYFISIGILPIFMCLWGCQKPWSQSYRQVPAAMWVVGIELRPSGTIASTLNAQPSLQPLPVLKKECFLWVFVCTVSLGEVSIQHIGVLSSHHLGWRNWI